MTGDYPQVATDQATFDAAMERARCYIHQHTRQLLGRSQESLELFGTCVLVKAGEAALAVTSAHAVDEVLRWRGVLAIGSTGDGVAPAFRLPADHAESVPPGEDRARDRVDVAAIPIPESVARLGARADALNLDEVDFGYEPRLDDVVVVCGYPLEHERHFEADGNPGVRAESAYFCSSPLSDLPRSVRPRDGSPAPSFALRYNRSPPMRAGIEGRAPHPRGLSGSGAWLLGRTDAATGRWEPLERPRLVGMVQEWHGQDQALVVTKASEIAPCLYLCPGAREAVLSVVPALAGMRRVEERPQSGGA